MNAKENIHTANSLDNLGAAWNSATLEAEIGNASMLIQANAPPFVTLTQMLRTADTIKQKTISEETGVRLDRNEALQLLHSIDDLDSYWDSEQISRTRPDYQIRYILLKAELTSLLLQHRTKVREQRARSNMPLDHVSSYENELLDTLENMQKDLREKHYSKESKYLDNEWIHKAGRIIEIDKLAQAAQNSTSDTEIHTSIDAYTIHLTSTQAAQILSVHKRIQELTTGLNGEAPKRELRAARNRLTRLLSNVGLPSAHSMYYPKNGDPMVHGKIVVESPGSESAKGKFTPYTRAQLYDVVKKRNDAFIKKIQSDTSLDEFASMLEERDSLIIQMQSIYGSDSGEMKHDGTLRKRFTKQLLKGYNTLFTRNDIRDTNRTAVTEAVTAPGKSSKSFRETVEKHIIASAQELEIPQEPDGSMLEPDISFEEIQDVQITIQMMELFGVTEDSDPAIVSELHQFIDAIGPEYESIPASRLQMYFYQWRNAPNEESEELFIQLAREYAEKIATPNKKETVDLPTTMNLYRIEHEAHRAQAQKFMEHFFVPLPSVTDIQTNISKDDRTIIFRPSPLGYQFSRLELFRHSEESGEIERYTIQVVDFCALLDISVSVLMLPHVGIEDELIEFQNALNKIAGFTQENGFITEAYQGDFFETTADFSTSSPDDVQRISTWIDTVSHTNIPSEITYVHKVSEYQHTANDQLSIQRSESEVPVHITIQELQLVFGLPEVPALSKDQYNWKKDLSLLLQSLQINGKKIYFDTEAFENSDVFHARIASYNTKNNIVFGRYKQIMDTIATWWSVQTISSVDIMVAENGKLDTITFKHKNGKTHQLPSFIFAKAFHLPRTSSKENGMDEMVMGLIKVNKHITPDILKLALKSLQISHQELPKETQYTVSRQTTKKA